MWLSMFRPSMLKDKFDRYFFLQRDDNVCGKLIKYLIVGISRIFHSYGHVTTSGEDLLKPTAILPETTVVLKLIKDAI